MAKVKLSPSRVKTLQGCGILYWNTYKLPNPLPRGRNSGSSRGSTVHYVLECLIRPDRKERVEKMIQFNDPWIDPATKRLAQIHADKLEVGDEENFEMIRDFILTALKTDFYLEGAEEVIVEHQFDIKTDDYHIGGFIDKLGVFPDKIKGVDYKSSKKKFTGDEVTFNLQNYFYTLALREKYPGKPTEFEFQFLKFPKKPVQESPSITDDEMKGFKLWLKEISEFIDNFTLEQAKSMAAKNGGWKTKWMCGARYGEMKADGSGPKWICESRYPYVYFLLRDENGKHISSEKDRTILEKIQKPGQTIEQHNYPGCSMWQHEWKNNP
jgi:hypothetical protein